MTLSVLVIGHGARLASAADFMYVALTNSTIVRYDVSLSTAGAVAASLSVFVPSGQGLSLPVGLAFDAAGNLYAANFVEETITRYDSSGNRIGTDFVPAGQGLVFPCGLAFDTAGNLYAANQSNNTITRYDPAGNRIGTDFVSGQGLNSPYGIAFDTAGNLYASNISGNTITRYNPSGNRIGTDFVGVGQGLNSPAGLAFDSAGNLYAANFGNSTIAKCLEHAGKTRLHGPPDHRARALHVCSGNFGDRPDVHDRTEAEGESQGLNGWRAIAISNDTITNRAAWHELRGPVTFGADTVHLSRQVRKEVTKSGDSAGGAEDRTSLT